MRLWTRLRQLLAAPFLWIAGRLVPMPKAESKRDDGPRPH